MSTPDSFCSHCGLKLDSPESICNTCDDLFYKEAKKADLFKYRCPSCGGYFNSPNQVNLPQNPRWYQIKTQKYQCPLCNAFLYDQKYPDCSLAFKISLSAGYMGLFFSGAYPILKPFISAFLLIFLGKNLIATLRAARSLSSEEDRYALLEPSTLTLKKTPWITSIYPLFHCGTRHNQTSPANSRNIHHRGALFQQWNA